MLEFGQYRFDVEPFRARGLVEAIEIVLILAQKQQKY